MEEKQMEQIGINAGGEVAGAREAKRLAEKYQKDFLDCEDLMKILGVGRGNVRELMRSTEFPTIQIGNRKVVSAIAFADWSLKRLDTS
jgi:predicted DNA-binding transcriptional regulator AlpA